MTAEPAASGSALTPALQPTPGAKMLYLIRRRPGTSREELVAHWFTNHMPAVIAGQHDAAARGKRHASRYLVTLFDADRDGRHPWDGMAQLWWDRPLRPPAEPLATTPTDTFQQKVEPHWPWATTEYVILDGSEHLPVEPLTLNAPFPCTRSGFYQLCFLLQARADADLAALMEHWIEVHVPNVRSTMERAGGFRYVVSHSLEPGTAPYTGLAELYFHDPAGWARYRELYRPDGMERWVDPAGSLTLTARTHLIGIP
jgi:hypothetical protein